MIQYQTQKWYSAVLRWRAFDKLNIKLGKFKLSSAMIPNTNFRDKLYDNIGYVQRFQKYSAVFGADGA